MKIEETIRFTDIYGTDLGKVELIDGKLVGSTELTKYGVEEWLEDGGTVQSYIEHFSEWTSGYRSAIADSRRVS